MVIENQEQGSAFLPKKVFIYYVDFCAGLVSIEQALSMTLGLEAERDFVAWYTLLDSLNTILNYFRHMDLPAAQVQCCDFYFSCKITWISIGLFDTGILCRWN